MQMTLNTHKHTVLPAVGEAFQGPKQRNFQAGVSPWEPDSSKRTPAMFSCGSTSARPVTYLAWPHCGLAGFTDNICSVCRKLDELMMLSHFLQSQIWLKLLTGSHVKLGFCILCNPRSKNNLSRSLGRWYAQHKHISHPFSILNIVLTIRMFSLLNHKIRRL